MQDLDTVEALMHKTCTLSGLVNDGEQILLSQGENILSLELLLKDIDTETELTLNQKHIE